MYKTFVNSYKIFLFIKNIWKDAGYDQKYQIALLETEEERKKIISLNLLENILNKGIPRLIHTFLKSKFP